MEATDNLRRILETTYKLSLSISAETPMDGMDIQREIPDLTLQEIQAYMSQAEQDGYTQATDTPNGGHSTRLTAKGRMFLSAPGYLRTATSLKQSSFYSTVQTNQSLFPTTQQRAFSAISQPQRHKNPAVQQAIEHLSQLRDLIRKLPEAQQAEAKLLVRRADALLQEATQAELDGDSIQSRADLLIKAASTFRPIAAPVSDLAIAIATGIQTSVEVQLPLV